MNTLKWVLRFVLVVFVFFLIGAGIYVGFPILYQQWVKPIEEQNLQLKDLKIQQDQNQENFSTRLSELQERIQALTLLQDKDKESIANLHQKIEEISKIKSTQEAISIKLEELKDITEKYITQLDTMNNQYSTLKRTQAEQQAAIATLSYQSQQQATTVAKRERELTLIKVLELLSHSRYAFLNNNYGSAQEGLLAARNLLSQTIQQQQPNQRDALSAIDQRLELVIANLISDPRLAEKDVDLLWQMVMNILSDNVSEGLAPYTPAPSPTAPTESATPTPLATERL